MIIVLLKQFFKEYKWLYEIISEMLKFVKERFQKDLFVMCMREIYDCDLIAIDRGAR